MTGAAGDYLMEPPSGPFRAEVRVPGDKSLSHRAYLLAAMADGVSEVVDPGPGRDVAATRAAVVRLGATVDGPQVTGPGVEAWHDPGEPIECGNSGTTMRLLAGALAGRPFRTVLSGDESLNRRPMRRLVAPLEALGATVEPAEGGTAPLRVGGGGPLHGAEVELEIASAQVRTAFSLAALQAEGPSRVTSPPGFRDHTERWLETMGLGEWEGRTGFRVFPGAVPPFRYLIPGDPSSAAFLWASAAIVPGSTVVTPGVSLNAGRIGFLQVLEEMGAVIEGEVTGSLLGDPVGTVTVRGRGLRAVRVEGELAVATLDELPLVAVLGAYAEGVTTVGDAAELRAKESDRIAASVALIRALGGGAEPHEDGFSVLGIGFLEAGTVESAGDHRMAMAAAVAASGATGPVRIVDAGAADVSWPGFFAALEGVWSSR